MTFPSISPSAPLSFSFSADNSIRVVMRNDEPWFVAADVCSALDLENATKALLRLDDDEKAQVDLLTTLNSIQGGNPQETGRLINLVNESGLYSLILGSRKPEAKAFKKWVTSEVLPSIRKTGRYQVGQVQSYQRINPKQSQALVSAMHRAFSHWIVSSESTRLHGYNRLRLDFNLHHVDDLPADDFPRAMATIKWMDAANAVFCDLITAQLDDYIAQSIDGGLPWTPALKRDWTATLNAALPPRPDWMAVQQQIANAKPPQEPRRIMKRTPTPKPQQEQDAPIKKSVTLATAYWQRARQIGNDNYAEGIRQALDAFPMADADHAQDGAA